MAVPTDASVDSDPGSAKVVLLGWLLAFGGVAAVAAASGMLDVMVANPGKAALAGSAVLVGIAMAPYVEFPTAADPGRAKTIFGGWILGIVAGVLVVVADALYQSSQVDFEHTLAVLAVLVLASLVAVDLDLG